MMRTTVVIQAISMVWMTIVVRMGVAMMVTLIMIAIWYGWH